MKSSNVIQFKPGKRKWETDENNNANISTIVKKKLFRNATLVDIENNSAREVDILVENGVIAKIEVCGKIKAETSAEEIDLYFDYVIPSFFDGFMEHRDIFGIEYANDEKSIGLVDELMGMKNILSGVMSYVGANIPNACVIDRIDDMDEKQLAEVSDATAKQKSLVFLKVGQTLEELGNTDKKFGKPLPYVLEDFGILDRDWILVGGNCLEKDDLRVFREYGDRYVVLPYEDAQMARRPVNLRTLMDLGFNIRLGTGSVFEVDYFAFMRQILTSQWQMFEDKSFIDEKDVLLMATENVPTLKEGDMAEFFVLKAGHSLYSTLLKEIVWGKSKKDVAMSVYRGEILQYEGGIISGRSSLDYAELIDEIKRLRRTKK